ncbi:MAG: c-type cytochrome [Leptospiraceae bacterium]|nr:c-type cytochrome [Leptospiraceae bacterium]
MPIIMQQQSLKPFVRFILLLTGVTIFATTPACKPAGASFEVQDKQSVASAIALFESQCGACHSISPEVRNGPALPGLFSHYRRLGSPDQIKQAVLEFSTNPRHEAVRMPEAVAAFGLMPKMEFQPEAVQAGAFLIANYSSLQAAGWFQKQPDKPAQSNGERLFLQNCGACHPVQPPPRNGPPARGMAMHYSRVYKSEQSFKQALLAYVQKPDASKSLMPDAIEEFGLMPRMQFNAQELDQIAGWIYQQRPQKQ